MTSLKEPDKILHDIKESKINSFLLDSYIKLGELTIVVQADKISTVIELLKEANNTKFEMLISICGADYPNKQKRFEVIYHLLSIRYSVRIRVKIEIDDEEFVPSIIGVFPCANWYEREVWDMYGIMFVGNPDLRRILTDYGFEGFPLRKDYPLTGNVEVKYDIERQKVVYQPVVLSQEYRNFDLLSPWNGPQHVIPGDEKATKE